MDKIEELKTGLASVGIGWVEPTDLRNKAGLFMLKRGVKMGVAVDPADVQTMLVDFARQALAHAQAPTKVIEWLRERHNKCLRHAAQGTGIDRDGWLDDAYYFELALAALAMRNSDGGPGPGEDSPRQT
jgi:hypothetical protein